MRILGVDPGDVHNGVALFEADVQGSVLRRLWTRSWSAPTLYGYLESCDKAEVVCESFHLYPELAREQGYSTFPTVRRIGAIEYICDRRNLRLTMQNATVKKPARRIGERLAPELGSIRTIGSARSKYRGWDWDAPSQHERDATCHAVVFAFRNKLSPFHDKDLKREVTLEWT